MMKRPKASVDVFARIAEPCVTLTSALGIGCPLVLSFTAPAMSPFAAVGLGCTGYAGAARQIPASRMLPATAAKRMGVPCMIRPRQRRHAAAGVSGGRAVRLGVAV